MIITRISFIKPFGNIRVDFPFGEHASYEVAFGHVSLTPTQAEEAEQHGWRATGKTFVDLVHLVEVARSMVAYKLLVARHAC